jgi:NADPH-dependent 2,4-dienoyl-CoA reductase/sulfur reductase-like enzyme/nitrite reductase/ring-hydroxylating ferredoxin subunit
MGGEQQLSGPDLAQGIAEGDLAEGAMLQGHANGEAVLLARVGGEVYAIGATCSHYGAPLKDGLLVGETVRCPWHHACFSLRSGVPLRPPALNDIPRWKVATKAGKIVVGKKLPVAAKKRLPKALAPESVLILGAGAAGNAAAETLRREGYRGALTLIDPDPSGPVDRPNLSKDYLAGNAPEDWIPLHPPDWYAEHRIELVLGKKVTALDVAQRSVTLDDGSARSFDKLIIATGADPVRPPIPASGTPVFYLRTLTDARAIIAVAKQSKRAALIGAGFIGLEVAASLRARGLEVHVIAPEAIPLERVMGKAVGAWVRALHEEKGVVFHLGESAKQITPNGVVLTSGATVPADFVVVGVGVRPNDQLAQAAGLKTERGILVNEFLETSAAGIYAAGDVARWPDPHTGQSVRIEHWVVAERQGQTAARNILGRRERFQAVPFFWSGHYDVSINYVGHAEQWDATQVDGDLAAKDATVRFVKAGKTLAVATVWRDQDSLKAELEMENR